MVMAGVVGEHYLLLVAIPWSTCLITMTCGVHVLDRCFISLFRKWRASLLVMQLCLVVFRFSHHQLINHFLSFLERSCTTLAWLHNPQATLGRQYGLERHLLLLVLLFILPFCILLKSTVCLCLCLAFWHLFSYMRVDSPVISQLVLCVVHEGNSRALYCVVVFHLLASSLAFKCYRWVDRRVVSVQVHAGEVVSQWFIVVLFYRISRGLQVERADFLLWLLFVRSWDASRSLLCVFGRGDSRCCRIKERVWVSA